MNQPERCAWLIEKLLAEKPSEYAGVKIPAAPEERKRLLRALMNVRPPAPAAAEFLRIQDEYLQEETRLKGVVTIESLSPAEPGISLWQGDITRLAADAIVNAANGSLLGCFVPRHGCIDNAIHSAAGVQLRNECAALMKRPGGDEPPGRARITGAYNLPCRFVLHTVGPVVGGAVTDEDRALLASCYHSCLALAAERNLRSVAFCCVSTGEFRFPNEEAASIAVAAVRGFLAEHKGMEVVFDVFKELDRKIYSRLLGAR
ncbi:protein-ADP-ribose hydrolase [Pyramidobacter porci]